jgi:hypothetical protein
MARWRNEAAEGVSCQGVRDQHHPLFYPSPKDPLLNIPVAIFIPLPVLSRPSLSLTHQLAVQSLPRAFLYAPISQIQKGGNIDNVTSSSGLKIAGSLVIFEPSGVTFSKPVKISVPYNTSVDYGSMSLRVFRWTNGKVRGFSSEIPSTFAFLLFLEFVSIAIASRTCLVADLGIPKPQWAIKPVAAGSPGVTGGQVEAETMSFSLYAALAVPPVADLVTTPVPATTTTTPAPTTIVATTTPAPEWDNSQAILGGIIGGSIGALPIPKP